MLLPENNTNPKILQDLRLGDPIQGEGPRTSLFGSDPKSGKKKLPQLEKTEHLWGKYKEYNDVINEHIPYVDKFMPRDNHMLIRCFKFEEDQTTESGLIIQNDVEWHESAGGQMKMRTSVNPYQKRAVVVKKGFLNTDNDFHNSLKEGTIVTLSTSKLDSGKFDTEPYKKGSKDLGYFLVHVGLVTGIEVQ